MKKVVLILLISVVSLLADNIYSIDASMSDRSIKKSVSVRMYGIHGQHYEDKYKSDLFLIKDAKNNKDARRYWAYLNMTMYSASLGPARGYVVGMPKFKSTKLTLIKAENIIRLKYDIPDNKIPTFNGEMPGLELQQPFTETIENYISTGVYK